MHFSVAVKANQHSLFIYNNMKIFFILSNLKSLCQNLAAYYIEFPELKVITEELLENN